MNTKNEMNDPQWEPTRREFEVDANGNRQQEKVTLEHKKRKLFGMEIDNTLDIVVKTVGVLAVFLPLVFISYGNYESNKEQKYKDREELYSQIVKDYAILFRHQSSDFSNLSTIDSVDFLLTSQLEFADENDVALFAKLDELNSNISMYSRLAKIILSIEDLKDKAANALRSLQHIVDSPSNMRFTNYRINYSNYKDCTKALPGFYDLRDEITADSVYGKVCDSLRQLFTDSLSFIDQEYVGFVQNVLLSVPDLPATGAKDVFFPPGFGSIISKDAQRIAENQAASLKNMEVLLHLKSLFFEDTRKQFFHIKTDIQRALKVR